MDHIGMVLAVKILGVVINYYRAPTIETGDPIFST